MEEDDPAAIALLVAWLYRGVIPGAKSESVYGSKPFPTSKKPLLLPPRGTEIKVEPYTEPLDTGSLFGTTSTQRSEFHSIVAHPHYNKFSQEELRLADYAEGRRDEFGSFTDRSAFKDITPLVHPPALAASDIDSATSRSLFGSGSALRHSREQHTSFQEASLETSNRRVQDGVATNAPSDDSAATVDAVTDIQPHNDSAHSAMENGAEKRIASTSSHGTTLPGRPDFTIQGSRYPEPVTPRPVISTSPMYQNGINVNPRELVIFGVSAFSNSATKKVSGIASSPFCQGMVNAPPAAFFSTSTVNALTPKKNIGSTPTSSIFRSSSISNAAAPLSPATASEAAPQTPQNSSNAFLQASGLPDSTEPLHLSAGEQYLARDAFSHPRPAWIAGSAAPASISPPEEMLTSRSNTDGGLFGPRVPPLQAHIPTVKQPPPELMTFYRTNSDHQTALLHLTIFAETTCWSNLYNAAILAYTRGEEIMERPPPFDHITLIYERTHDDSTLRTWAVDTLSSSHGEIDKKGYLSLLVEYEGFLEGVLMKVREQGRGKVEEEKSFNSTTTFKYAMMEHGMKRFLAKGKGKENVKF